MMKLVGTLVLLFQIFEIAEGSNGCITMVIVATNPCNPNPCENGGICTPQGEDAVCTCVTGFSGPLCKTKDIFTSCYDVCLYHENENPPDGKYLLDNGKGETYLVHCEFMIDQNRIHTYIARTNLTYINIGALYNNGGQILVRHKRTSGIQYEAMYGQISQYSSRDMIINYNSYSPGKPIHNPGMAPYIYVAMLNKSEVYKHAYFGYSVWGKDHLFWNCDGNQNTYFALLFNANNTNNTGRKVGNKKYMSYWKDEATQVENRRCLDDEFFVTCEMHFGGCGGYLTCDHLSDIEGVTFGFLYMLNPCKRNPCKNGGNCSVQGGEAVCTCAPGFVEQFCEIDTTEVFTSCYDVYLHYENDNPPDGKYLLDNGNGETYLVHCEFMIDQNRIHTYIASTNLTYINIGALYNNGGQILVRHKRTSGIQYEAMYGQVSQYSSRDMVINYNSYSPGKPIHNPGMAPYIYVAMLNKSEVYKHANFGYSVWGRDHLFWNCDGNQNTYFALLFNANNTKNTGRKVGNKKYMSYWKDEAAEVENKRYLDDEFFVTCEMHFGGCGGYLTCDHLSDIEGVTFGFLYMLNPCRRNPCKNGGNCSAQGGEAVCTCAPGFIGQFCDINTTERFSSCHQVYYTKSNVSDGNYLLDNGFGDTYLVHCEFRGDHIYTYIARSHLTNIPIGALYNNGTEILVRHKRKLGLQYEASYGQIARFSDRDMIIQYNSYARAKPIHNPAMMPYVYVAMLNKSEVSKHVYYGYSIWGKDHLFYNCDGNQNTYFALLFNTNNAQTTGRKVDKKPYMSYWKTEAKPVILRRYLDDIFFVSCEVHFGGCGGYLTCDHLPDIDGVTFGFRYDLN